MFSLFSTLILVMAMLKTHISTIIDLTLLNIKIRTLYTFYLLIAVPQRYKFCILMLIKAILT